MNVKQFSPEELKELSMIELTHIIMEGRKEAIVFSDLVQEITDTLGLSQEQVTMRLAQFYTDLNVDGRFITIGENRWGLRSWYPYEQIDEEILPQAKPKKKRKYDEDELDEFVAEDYDELDEVEDLEDLDEELEEIDEDLEDLDEEIDEDLEEEEDLEDLDVIEYDETDEEEEV